MTIKEEEEELHKAIAEASDQFEGEYIFGSRPARKASQETDELHKAVAEALDQLEREYGIARGFTSKSGAVLVMEVCRSTDGNPGLHVAVSHTVCPRCVGMEQGVGLSDRVLRGSLCAMEDSRGARNVVDARRQSWERRQ